MSDVKHNIDIDEEHKHVEHIKPYTKQFGTMVPSGTQKFLRTCVIWQVYRLLAINVKMITLIIRSHH